VTRAFVAVSPPRAVLDAVEVAATEVDLPGGRRTSREQWHITLQFLGNVDDLDAVAAALDGLAARATRGRLGGAGAFPTARRAKVLWLGLAEGGEALAGLARAVAELLQPLGFVPEDRPYHPHLTLGRTKVACDLRAVVARLDACELGPAFSIDEVVVYESRLRRAGAEYVPRAVIRLPS
jgi:2'-5' RNA ligase